MNIDNRSRHPDDIIHDIITTAIDNYAFPHPTYTLPHRTCDVIDKKNGGNDEMERKDELGGGVEIIVVDTPEEVAELAMQLTGETIVSTTCNGIFIRGIPLRILVCVSDEAISGAECFFKIKENQDLSGEEKVANLMEFCILMEVIQHEYTHLCSFVEHTHLCSFVDHVECDVAEYDIDEDLYDEEHARYRGIISMLTMIQPYVGRDFLLTMWTHYSVNVLSLWKEQVDNLQELLSLHQKVFEDALKSMDMPGEILTQALEKTLGHELEHHGEFTEDGIPKVSQVEVVEYYLHEEGEQFTPLLYFAKDINAIYEGAQLMGLVHGFRDFLTGERRVIWKDVPYYESTHSLREDLDEIDKAFFG